MIKLHMPLANKSTQLQNEQTRQVGLSRDIETGYAEIVPPAYAARAD